MWGYMLILAAVVIIATGCSSGSKAPVQVSDAENVASDLRKDYGNKYAVIVRKVDCRMIDSDHFDCTLTYETGKGDKRTVSVAVTCDDEACAWEEN